jgi:FkbM family methyltransferase
MPANMRELLHRAVKAYVRSFPMRRGKQRLVDCSWRLLSSGITERETVLRLAGVRMRCDISQQLQRKLYFHGAYEPDLCAYWLRMAARARVVFDVGANVGLYTLLAAVTNRDAQVHAFEPTDEVRRRLIVNLQLNAVSNVTVESRAVARTPGTAFLHECRGSDGSNEGMNFVTNTAGDRGATVVATTSLDAYCRELRIDRIDLMKMDIEGGECEALLGSQDLLGRQAIGCVLLEHVDWSAERAGHTTAHVRELLAGHGYVVRKLVDGTLRPVHPTNDVGAAVAEVIAIPEATL